MRAAAAVCALLLATLMLSSVSVQAATPGKIKVKVVDPAGAVMGQAYLLFHSDPAGTGDLHPDVIAAADDYGRFEVELAPGFYDVCVMAPAFAAQCKKFLVEEGKTIQHNVTLTLDPLVFKHIGERFPER